MGLAGASHSSQSEHSGMPHRPCTVKPLPPSLLDHVTVCFEEQLYSQAFALLTNVLTSETGIQRCVHVPPIQHLDLAATLAAHPSLTTRTLSQDKLLASDDALRYLRLLQCVAGPADSGLTKALRFREPGASRAKRARTRQFDPSGDDRDATPGQIRSIFVSKESLLTNASDFWSIVGWTFNCSIAHKHRWERLKLLLGCMIQILEDDLESRISLNAHSQISKQEPIRDSLLMHYLNSVGAGRNNKRRIMRAILADGSSRARAEYGEIWKNETKVPKQRKDDVNERKRKLDIEHGDYGDYDQDSDDATPDHPSSPSRSATRRSSMHSSRASSDVDSDDNEGDQSSLGVTSTEQFGGSDSMLLRQRLLALLVQFCSICPETFLDTENLFDLYAEFLTALPLPVFQHLILPTRHYLDEDHETSLNLMLLRPLIDASAPTYNTNELTQQDFETHYAPFAANVTSFSKNAKVSLVIEGLLRLLWKTDALTYSKGLKTAVHAGIKARTSKALFDARRKTESKSREEEECAAVMEASAQRMMAVIDMIQR